MKELKTIKREKVERYQDLATELRKTWNTSVTVVPFVVGTLGAVCKSADQAKHKQKEIPKVQFAALLGSERTLRKVLDFSG